jgi:DNA-binding transcriptional LysR family regulator
MDIKQLNALIAVADTGSVTRAAEVLRIVQPAVTRQIQLLEQELGCELFERSRQGMRLTDSGRTMVNRTRRALGELDRAKAEIQPAPGQLHGTVTIGLLASTADLLAEALVRTVRRQHPGLMLRISSGYAGHLREWLEAGDVDIALLYGLKPSSTMEVRPLLEEKLWAVAPIEEGLDADTAVRFTDVAPRALVMPSPPHGLRALVDGAAARTNVSLNIVTETNAVSVQKKLVMGGLAWTILPALAVADDVTRGTLSAAPLAAPTITRRIVLALPKNTRQPPAVRVVADLLVAEMSAAVQRGDWPSAKWLAS